MRRALGLALFTLALVFAPASWAGPGPLAEVVEILDSAAGRMIARELGISSIAAKEMVAGRVRIAPDETEELAGSLERIRERVLGKRPRFLEIEIRRSVDIELYKHPELRAITSHLNSYALAEAEFEIASAPHAFPGGLPSLPPVFTLSVGRSEARALFGVARKEFVEGFDPGELTSLLDAVESNSLSSDQRAALKTQRKLVVRVRSAFDLFDETHEAPAGIKTVAKDLGKLNDALENGRPDLAAKLARELKTGARLPTLVRELARFAPGKRKSFGDYLGSMLKDIRKLAAKRVLPIERFHDLRKELKEIMNLLYFGEKMGTEPWRKPAYQYLYDLNEGLGRLHDGFVSEDLRGINDYEGREIRVPDELRAAVEDFARRVELD